ncbi:MAG TPA: hypothetical protein VNH11_10595 [Pirellulales bacterium]|nr:hypothetical protein [Pirellulales bacterium]
MTPSTTEATVEQQNLATRIEGFYHFLNAKQWQKCFDLVDPKLRDAGEVEIAAYTNSLSSFFAKHGPMVSQTVERLRLYVNAPNKHDDRDFAYGLVALEDREHHSLKIRERWVKASDGRWYTRTAGMV